MNLAPPEVSVVMGVYNGAKALPATLESILAQRGCDFELIVVNDGSTDESGSVLDEWAARDPRLQVIHQNNTGLTKALIRGCCAARGEFIARHDCGDVSLPGRFAAQMQLLRGDQLTVMTACGARFVGPGGEALHEIIRVGGQLQQGLDVLDLNLFKGPPHHGATMFRRADYMAVGGYRVPFVVAQDIDLWLRLAERGRCIGMAEVGYVASLEASSISGRRRDDQFRMARLAIDCARRRRQGASDQALLDAFAMAPQEGRVVRRPSVATERARFYYFIGACLRGKDPVAAKLYFRRAIVEKPLFLKAWLRSILG